MEAAAAALGLCEQQLLFALDVSHTKWRAYPKSDRAAAEIRATAQQGAHTKEKPAGLKKPAARAAAAASESQRTGRTLNWPAANFHVKFAVRKM